MVAILLGEGFEEMEAMVPCDLLRRAGIPVQLVGLDGSIVTGSHGIRVCADTTIGQLSLDELELLMLPGGLGGVASIRGCEAALHAIANVWEQGKYLAAICAAPTVLAELGIVGDRKATCYPGMEKEMGNAQMQEKAPVVADGKLLTGAAAGTAIDFGLMLVRALRGSECAQKVSEGIYYPLAQPERSLYD